jgi:hypothetical protein
MLGEQMAIHTMGLNPATRALATASGRGIGSLKRARLPRILWVSIAISLESSWHLSESLKRQARA